MTLSHHLTRALLTLGAVAALCVGCQAPQRAAPPLPTDVDLTAAEPPASALWLDTLDLTQVDQDWGKARAGRSIEDRPISIGGKVFQRGIGSHANSEFTVALNGAARAFHAEVGVNDEAGTKGSVVFVVLVDGREVRRTGVLTGGQGPEPISVDLTGAKTLTLIIEDADNSIDTDHADWAGALLLLQPDATFTPTIQPRVVDPPPQIAMGHSPVPAINAPRITGGTPGHDFMFRIPATGAPPLTFAAQNLPAGLTLDPNTGIISGVLESEGRTDVLLAVRGPHGRSTSRLTIVAGPDALALTPPMGWNSWNVWGTAVDDAKVRAAADAMVASGLAAAGYQYINIDDGWEAGRDADGNILSNEKFPDMQALADYVHARGLKLGIYSSPGPRTCAGYEGSYGHELQDARTWAAWGIDLVKYDWCSYGGIAKDDSLAELKKPYETMRDALAQCGRDIVYSLCQYGMGNVSQWGNDVGGHYWRTTGDIHDSWSSMSGIGFGQADLAEHAGPGGWNDPDMLVVGKLGWGPNIRDTHLTPHEQVTHITLWALLAAPLLTGCDLTQLDDFTIALLTNPDVIEVSQDPLGRQARRIRVDGQCEVWARPLADGTYAVGLFNRGRQKATIKVRWAELGLRGQQPVRDLWQRRDLGLINGSYAADVARHGAVLIKVGQPKP